MKSPEFFVHGTASEQDAESIQKTGFDAIEGRATVSGNLIHALEWATDVNKREASLSESLIKEGERGHIIVMSSPEGFHVDYSTQTDIRADDSKKEITGYTSKFQSGRKQLGIYGQEGGKDKVENTESKQKIHVPKEHVVMNLVPSDEIKLVLSNLSDKLYSLQSFSLEEISANLIKVIENDPRNIILQKNELGNAVTQLVESTVKSIAVNIVRALYMDIKRLEGYKIYNRREKNLIEKEVSKKKTEQAVFNILSALETKSFDTGIPSVNRYLEINLKKFKEELARS